jgi:hypothetical protein
MTTTSRTRSPIEQRLSAVIARARSAHERQYERLAIAHLCREVNACHTGHHLHQHSTHAQHSRAISGQTEPSAAARLRRRDAYVWTHHDDPATQRSHTTRTHRHTPSCIYDRRACRRRRRHTQRTVHTRAHAITTQQQHASSHVRCAKAYTPPNLSYNNTQTTHKRLRKHSFGARTHTSNTCTVNINCGVTANVINVNNLRIITSDDTQRTNTRNALHVSVRSSSAAPAPASRAHPLPGNHSHTYFVNHTPCAARASFELRTVADRLRLPPR